MKNETLYNKTVDILVQAYFEGTLEHGNCYACAVGNIIAANCGYRFLRYSNENKDIYWKGFTPYNQDWTETIREKGKNPSWFSFVKNPHITFNKELAIQQVNSTGYTKQELFKIETAFENYKENTEDSMFDGLMSVINCLDEIHENTDTNVTEQTKIKFKKQLA